MGIVFGCGYPGNTGLGYRRPRVRIRWDTLFCVGQ